MIKIQDVVEQIVTREPEVFYALSRGYINLSAYAQSIHKRVESLCKKKVLTQSIVVSLSRLQQKLPSRKESLRSIKIKDITIKTPLTELVFTKKESVLKNISAMYKKVQVEKDEFLTMTQSTSEVTIICSQRLVPFITRVFDQRPIMSVDKLASIGLSLHPKYYTEANVTYSLLHKIAQHNIVLAETITTHTEIIFVFSVKNLEQMVSLFTENLEK